MEYQRKAVRAARWSRTKAFFFTLLFHLGLLFAIASSGDKDWKEYVPDTVKSWLGMEAPAQEDVKDFPRP